MQVSSTDLVEYLRKIKFIGPFPQGIEVLLVPIDTALKEAECMYSDLKIKLFKSFLKKENIFVFNTIEDYAKYKGLPSTKFKRPVRRL